MKQLFTLLLLLSIVIGANAQYIYNDFDGNQNETFEGWPNVPSVIANPDPSGANTSPNVAEWVRSEEQWAHIFSELDGKIDFATGDFFYLKVWSPIACQLIFKLEDKNNSSIFTQVTYDLTTTNQWVEVAFDFTGTSSGVYDKIVIFLDFATTTNNTYYIDDIIGPEIGGSTPPKPLLAADVQENFENDGWSTDNTWSIQDPDIVDLPVTTDPVNSANHVGDYARSGSFEYTNAQTVLEHRMDLTTRNTFSVDVYFPSSNAYGDDLTSTAAVKLQNSLLGPNAWTTQTEIKLDVTTYDSWVTLEFDFSGISDSVDYDQIVIQFGGEGHFIPGQFYFDNFQLLNPVGLGDFQEQTISIYPNPATDFIKISGVKEIENVSIYSVSGQQVWSLNSRTDNIDISDLQQGLYFIHVLTNDGQEISSRFVKK